MNFLCDSFLISLHFTRYAAAYITGSTSSVSTVATMMREEAKKAGSEISVDVGDVTYTNDDKTQAKVHVTIKGKEGKDSEESDDIPLIKTEDGWKVVFD